MLVRELFAGDATSLRVFAHLCQKQTGQTRLMEYFGKDRRKSVADWTRTVKERVRRAALDPDARNRGTFPARKSPRDL
jgi:hypothetical protein